MTGGQAVVAALEALDVRHVFGIISVHNLPIVDAIASSPAVEMVEMRHEQGAVHAADGYARATGKLGVALASTGPGTANAMGGLFEAHFASSPVLLLTGQTETTWYGKGRSTIHEAERQLDMLRTVVRSAERPRFQSDIHVTVLRVARDILSGRPQPGAVEIPIDLQYARGEVALEAPRVPVTHVPDAAALDRAAELLRGARRPLIWAGGGVVTGDASAALTAFAEQLGAPVLTSVEGRGAIAEDHPLALGPHSDLTVFDPVIAGADVVLAVGTRFQLGGNVLKALSIPGRLVHVDVDPAVVDRFHPVDVAVVGDAGLALAGLSERLAHAAAEAAWVDEARGARGAAEADAREAMGADHEKIMETIRAALPRDAIVAKDATIAAYAWANRMLAVYEPRTSLRPVSMAIGPGLPLAIGACVATRRRTVVVHGDGGLMLSVGELVSAVQQRLPLVMCVFNDRGYGMLRVIQDMMAGGRHTAVDLATPDFAALAEAMGMRGERAATVDEFEAAFTRAVAHDGPTLIDVDITRMTPMRIVPQRPATRRR